MANLLENYAKRLAVSESVYSKSHEGAKLSKDGQMAVAMVLNNTNRFMNEAFSNSVGTQRADLGEWKKFCLNLTTVALPNLIAQDLVIVHPMASISGYITYVQYTAGSNKGTTGQGDVFNDPFRLGKVDPTYTSSAVVDAVKEAGSLAPAWTPVVKGAIAIEESGVVNHFDAKFIAEDGTVTGLKLGEDGKFTVPGAGRVAYLYDNVVIPQHDLPIVNAEIKSLPLVARARRVAVYYSQIAAFQAKTDYGFDLAEQLAEKAVGQLSYEIDTEITDMLIKMAGEATVKFCKVKPAGISLAEHYEAFSEKIEDAKAIVYDRTKRFAPNYMLIASNILPMLTFIKGFKAASTGKINGPYLAGTLNGVKVFVTPNIEKGHFVLGVNGDDMMSSAAVYAPYMAIVPTQLLGYADGGMSQGWSTMYALEPLNKDLLVAGVVTETLEESGATFIADAR